ncbi:hypothetical protein MYP_116 [Sporocytophaga myxococcoides]|uniref:Response regulatory domain-containing protein n=1 Tax=Sporocytophaga myxococcoides TaxID=153721 RepID=A0A098L8A4_9BACT|nr:hypothetical protein [Sporocytophaga myxococcoides]GAL82890.1 hypothetical protein MYP_116 [Sporocytophaga myxococcoides]
MNRLILLENSKTSFGSLHRELEERGFLEFRVYNLMKDFINESFQKKEDLYLVVIDSLVADFSMQTLQHLKEKFPDDYLLLVHNIDDRQQQKIAERVGVNNSIIKSSNTADQIKKIFTSLGQKV